jgi:hypothetical protein
VTNALKGLASQVRFTLIDEAAEPTLGSAYSANVGAAYADDGYVTLTASVRSQAEAEELKAAIVAASLSPTTFLHVTHPGSTLSEPLVLRPMADIVNVQEMVVSFGALKSSSQWTVAFNAALVAQG